MDDVSATDRSGDCHECRERDKHRLWDCLFINSIRMLLSLKYLQVLNK